MTFHGLFVGIDHYQSLAINTLTCAKRDAVALHALFTDTLGGHTTLLVDGEATRAAIAAQFASLARCDPTDVVIVAFSGHGSDTQHLVTHDADPRHLPDTAISLDVLTEWFARIPACRLVCFLDCCFSGGMGARVLHVDSTPRGLASAADLLDRMAGVGRVIVTASTATEEALEQVQLRHGLLTYYLLEALQGTPEALDTGQISLYPLLHYVTQRVVDQSSQWGSPQHPTVRGQIDGEVRWPVFVPGPLFHAAFPERQRALITAEVSSLTTYGFPPDLLTVWGNAIPSLNPLQQEAINTYGLLEEKHLVVSAPTSSGKTLLGELAALKATLERQRACFLFPLKALVNDKFQHFTRLYSSYGVRIIRATGEISDDIPALLRGQFDICLMTYEKFSALVLGHPYLLQQLGLVVVDEAQMIADPTRGVNLEFVLTLLRMRRTQGIEPQLLLLSAVIGTTNGLERWLGARLLRHTERPVPLDEGLLCADGRFRYLDAVSGDEHTEASFIQREGFTGKTRDWLIPLVRRLVGEGKQVIVFRATKDETRFCARYLADALGLPSAHAALDALPLGDPSAASTELRGTLDKGVAFHNADLDRAERLVIEEHFRAPQGALRVIVATTTLAMGVNTPASAVVIVGLTHPKNQPYTIAEYKNIVGRAGRLGFSERGSSYLLASSPLDEHHYWSRYILGSPEDVQSCFLAQGTDPRSLVLRVLAAIERQTASGPAPEDILGFLENSFGVFQQLQREPTWRWDRTAFQRALDEVQQYGLIEWDASATGYRLTALGRLAGEGGIAVTSMLRLIYALRTVNPTHLTDLALITVAQLTQEVEELLFPLNTRSTQKEPTFWLQELRRQGIPESLLLALQQQTHDAVQSTLRAKKAVACLLWISDMPLTLIERTMTQFGGSPGGAAGPIRQVAQRTADLLPTVARVAELLHPRVDMTSQSTWLLARMQTGASTGLAFIASQLGSRLSRGEYQRLAHAGLTSVSAFDSTPDSDLLTCLERGPDQNDKLRLLRAALVHVAKQASNPDPLAIPLYEA